MTKAKNSSKKPEMNIIPRGAVNFILENNKVLVLDKNGNLLSQYGRKIPSVISEKDAIKLVLRNAVDILVPSNKLFYADPRNKQEPIFIPKVIQLHNATDFDRQTAKLTRKNLFLRDDFTCQYSGFQVKPVNHTHVEKFLNQEHVTPRSKGGKDSWDNLVAARIKINTERGNMPLEQFYEQSGYMLRRQPYAPTLDEIFSKAIFYNPQWMDDEIVDFLYWNIEFEDSVMEYVEARLQINEKQDNSPKLRLVG